MPTLEVVLSGLMLLVPHDSVEDSVLEYDSLEAVMADGEEIGTAVHVPELVMRSSDIVSQDEVCSEYCECWPSLDECFLTVCDVSGLQLTISNSLEGSVVLSGDKPLCNEDSGLTDFCWVLPMNYIKYYPGNVFRGANPQPDEIASSFSFSSGEASAAFADRRRRAKFTFGSEYEDVVAEFALVKVETEEDSPVIKFQETDCSLVISDAVQVAFLNHPKEEMDYQKTSPHFRSYFNMTNEFFARLLFRPTLEECEGQRFHQSSLEQWILSYLGRLGAGPTGSLCPLIRTDPDGG